MMFNFWKKEKFEGEQFLEGATDIHCHILPGVDDGFGSLQSSVELLEREALAGIKRVYLTPHSMGNSGAVVDPNSYRESNHHAHKSHSTRLPLDEIGFNEILKKENLVRHEDGTITSGDNKLVSSVVIQAAYEREYDQIDLQPKFEREKLGGYSDAHLKEKFNFFKNHYKGKIELRLAAEYMMNAELLEKVKNRDLLTYSDGKHVLVETSYFHPPLEMDEILYSLKIEGYIPILAHPERYRYMTKEDYQTLKDKGIEFQLNYLALTGYYGKHIMTRAIDLLERGMYEYTGSDYHRTSTFLHNINKLKLNTKRTEALKKLFTNNANL